VAGGVLRGGFGRPPPSGNFAAALIEAMLAHVAWELALAVATLCEDDGLYAMFTCTIVAVVMSLYWASIRFRPGDMNA
jgi:hypothetical protein